MFWFWFPQTSHWLVKELPLRRFLFSSFFRCNQIHSVVRKGQSQLFIYISNYQKFTILNAINVHFFHFAWNLNVIKMIVSLNFTKWNWCSESLEEEITSNFRSCSFEMSETRLTSSQPDSSSGGTSASTGKKSKFLASTGLETGWTNGAGSVDVSKPSQSKPWNHLKWHEIGLFSKFKC